MVITFLFKTYQNKPDLHVLNRSWRGCYLTGAKFWQRNCKAMQRMERRRFEYSCAFCINSLLAAKPKHFHAQKQFQQLWRLSNQRFHLLIFDWRTPTYPKRRVIVKKYSIENNKKASAHSPFLQKPVWETFVIIMIIIYTMYKGNKNNFHQNVK